MGKYDRPDTVIDGQITLEEYLDNSSKLIAVSRIFADARKNMTVAEQKTFVYALSQMRFTEPAKSNIVYLDKKKLAEIVGVNSDPDHLSVDLFRKIEELPKHSYIKIAEKDLKLFDSGMFITRLTMLKNRVRIKFEDEYLPLFTGLSTNYITMWSADILKMSSVRTIKFYEYLRQNMDTRDRSHSALIGIRKFKELFDMPESGPGSYMREKDGFNRSDFEHKVIDPLCEDMKHCVMIKLHVQDDGRYYKKIKEHGRVAGYEFTWDFTERPSIATAEEMKEIKEDPEALKIAKDIINGKKPKKKSTFNDFEQRKYDYDALEASLMGAKK